MFVFPWHQEQQTRRHRKELLIVAVPPNAAGPALDAAAVTAPATAPTTIPDAPALNTEPRIAPAAALAPAAPEARLAVPTPTAET